jgi:hypothetical protein
MIVKATIKKDFLSNFKNESQKKTALVCIAKNEDNYIQEWVNYYKKLGFDNIFIYQNNWRCPIDDPNVIKIEFDGDVKQVQAYNHFILNYKHEYDWAAFFDVDEFLVLKKHNNVKDFIKDYSDNNNAIAINWVFFGDSGHETINGNYSVLERFTMRQTKCNFHVKCIININKEGIAMDVHNPNCVWTDPNGKINSGPFNHEGSDEIAQLNHYAVKTKEEFKAKCDRGRADTTGKRSADEFDVYNANETEDLAAYNFFKN